jgi:hypothetical protein
VPSPGAYLRDRERSFRNCSNADQINNAVRSAENLPWGDHAPEQPDRVTEEFDRLLQASQADERVKKMITKLFQGAAYQTL